MGYCLSGVSAEGSLWDHSENKAHLFTSSPSLSECPRVAGGFYGALGVLIPGRKAKSALGSWAIINCVTLAAKGINLHSEPSCIFII